MLFRGLSSAGRALQWHCRGQGFDPPRLHQKDGGSAFQTLQLQMLGAFAQFERTVIRKRQAEGIAKAKAQGWYAQRKRTVNPKKIKQLVDDVLTKAAIAKKLNISRMSVHRSLQG